MKNSIVMKNVKKNYPNFKLNINDLKIPQGSIVGLIGENGAGKTTTLRILLNLIQKETGSIEIFEKDSILFDKIIKQEIGVVMDDSFFSDYLMIPDIAKIMKNFYDSWNDTIFYDYIKKFNLPLNKMMNSFSSGMKRKVKIITALSHQPKLLLLDEPTSGLDPVVRNEILDILREFVEDENHTILFSSHITTDLEHIADYIAFIHEGNIILFETIDTLLEEYGIAKVSESDFKTLDKKDYIACLKNKYQIDVLVSNKEKFSQKYRNLLIDKITLEELMILEIKGSRL